MTLHIARHFNCGIERRFLLYHRAHSWIMSNDGIDRLPGECKLLAKKKKEQQQQKTAARFKIEMTILSKCKQSIC